MAEEVGHGPKRLMEVKIDQSETRKLRKTISTKFTHSRGVTQPRFYLFCIIF